MSKKAKPLNVLYVEDEKEDYATLQMNANPHRVVLHHETNLEDGIEAFKQKGDRFFDGIILDALCMVRRDDSGPKKGHVLKAWKEFDALAPNLLKVVYTGETAFAEDLQELLAETKVPVFNKGNREDVEKMLAMLVEEGKNKEDRKIIGRYSDIFDSIEKYLEPDAPDASSRMLSCIKNMTNTDNTAITGTLGNLRKMQEYLYLALNRIDNNMVPDHLLVGDKGNININNKRIIDHIKGNFDRTNGVITTEEYVKHNSKEDRLLNHVYKGCSEEIHVTEQHTTRYTVQSLVFAFMDLVLWLKDQADSRHNISSLQT